MVLRRIINEYTHTETAIRCIYFVRLTKKMNTFQSNRYYRVIILITETEHFLQLVAAVLLQKKKDHEEFKNTHRSVVILMIYHKIHPYISFTKTESEYINSLLVKQNCNKYDCGSITINSSKIRKLTPSLPPAAAAIWLNRIKTSMEYRICRACKSHYTVFVPFFGKT